MRLWTVHPEYLDRQGLVALWREALLAQQVLRGMTRGYRAHPQLTRFREHPDPLGAIGFYLSVVLEESLARGYRFDGSKIMSRSPVEKISETLGQLMYEWEHLLSKLAVRDMRRYAGLKEIDTPMANPLFSITGGEVRGWERT